MKFNIVLVEPEIPQNTGNIARTCSATGSTLHLVRPLGFEVTDKQLKRAGLDYWHLLDIRYYDSIEEVLQFFTGDNFYFMSTKGKKVYSDARFKDGDYLVFGKETHGLNELLLEKYYEQTLRIPMIGEARSLNLSNSVALTVYEAIRQNGFENLLTEGHLTGRKC
ncbi:MAG: tRNA (uridine(34)/cytosine(34)/5-carboxymethylaminomethyluridine(34)-2'-O)-methyltransferase TrmL [Clostridia bacterium]|nr:tRNA (uridine(34)/cytosine(34)/5-carboxymethylaminomethyluridine(34)-2'-O)-methyltransferase TrmL [Clostridia bacterium]MBQ4586336.1 tRNA (uridine(34)/cytosine(34)/5-carboxymethylaminomethyluridine(34)-2'-O)-methyltransferase TrmL [Clostridia bacterium]MBQ6883880.1 tRNA (uridine(34)/cytosine(34)/5-carboxymethylaminomethyluridine(34)-2'-O)-methyltransferase TrmL [Clostridia bacterium]MBR2933950.1 tRNA (uridine(34)/cytosine(34)/5-carboxymethylaminomethyluridine(34)-2'-O)-methyltransferase TrmL 